jgi:hypothetical protein
MKVKLKYLLILLLADQLLFCQDSFFGEEVKWTTQAVPVDTKIFQDSIVILDEMTVFDFFPFSPRPDGSSINADIPEKVRRNVIFKINSKIGAEIMSRSPFPESFDPAYDGSTDDKSIFQRASIPYVQNFKMTRFAARKFASNKWTTVKFKTRYRDRIWEGKWGYEENQQSIWFLLEDVKKGDIVEIYYEAEFSQEYGSNIYYFNSAFPKQKSMLEFNYRITKDMATKSFIFPIYIPDSCKKKEMRLEKNLVHVSERFTTKNIQTLRYPSKARAGNHLPHIFIDFTFYRIITNSYPTGSGRIYDVNYIHPSNFEWFFIIDTTDVFYKVYDKHYSTYKKFVSTLPPTGSDSANHIFFRALCDTLNNFRYYTTRELKVDENNYKNISSGDHLLKRRLMELNLEKVYMNILYNNKIFYYLLNIQDKRLGEHVTQFRAHYPYEVQLLAFPYKNKFIYFVPRYNGNKYHLNELPFYFEGALASMLPLNFSEDVKNKGSYFNKFVRTHSSSQNDNTRTENATVKISFDSSIARLTIKEILSGQYSTILRHMYLNEQADSSVSPSYFKKCTDKPGSSETKIKLSSKVNEYPFRYTFACSEKIKLSDPKNISLKGWFSFYLNKNTIPEKPAHDYYFDFKGTDTYNFSLDLGKNAEVVNQKELTKEIVNEIYELKTELTKNSDTNYLFKVQLIIKSDKVSLENMDLLMKLVDELENLNSSSIQFAPKN